MLVLILFGFILLLFIDAFRLIGASVDISYNVVVFNKFQFLDTGHMYRS